MRPLIDFGVQGAATLLLLVGLWLLGNQRLLGPLLAALSEVLWVLVFVAHHIWGGLVLSSVLFALQARNFWKWRRDGVRW